MRMTEYDYSSSKHKSCINISNIYMGNRFFFELSMIITTIIIRQLRLKT